MVLGRSRSSHGARDTYQQGGRDLRGRGGQGRQRGSAYTSRPGQGSEVRQGTERGTRGRGNEGQYTRERGTRGRGGGGPGRQEIIWPPPGPITVLANQFK